MGNYKDPVFSVPEPDEPEGETGDAEEQTGDGMWNEGEAQSQAEAPEEAQEADIAADVKLGAVGIIVMSTAILLAVVIGIFINRYTAIPAAILGVIISTAILSVFKKLRMNRLIVNSILLSVIVFSFVVAIFIGYPLWLRNFNVFRERVEEACEKIDSTAASKKDEHSENLPSFLTKFDVSTRGSVSKALGNVGRILSISTGAKATFLFQMCLFSAAMVFFPVLIVAVTPGLGEVVPPEKQRGFMAWIGPGLFRLVHAVGDISLARVFKAGIITTAAIIGLSVSGLSAVFFVGGIVMCTALVCSLSPLIVFAFGLIPALLSANLFHAIGGLVITTALICLIEAKLHWFLFFLPPAQRRMFMPNPGRSKVGMVIGKVAALIPHVISLAVFVALIAAVIQVGDVFMKNSAREKAIREADKMRTAGQHAEAADRYNQIINDSRKKGNPLFVVPGSHPGDIQVYYSMLRCRLQQAEFDKAIKLAKHLSTFAPKPPESGIVNQVRYKILEIIVKNESSRHSPEKGLEMVAKSKEFRRSTNSERFRKLATNLFEIEKDNFWGQVCNARAAYIDEDYEAGLQHCTKGLARYPENEALLQIQAETYAKLGRWNDCKATCEKVLDLDGENEELKDLLKMCIDPALRPIPPVPETEGGEGETQGTTDAVPQKEKTEIKPK